MAKGKSSKGNAGWPTKNGTSNDSGKGRINNPPKSTPKPSPKKR